MMGGRKKAMEKSVTRSLRLINNNGTKIPGRGLRQSGVHTEIQIIRQFTQLLDIL
jgi:hypothetical protein